MGKKKKHEHHGGAWKVAYADFVTAMMALFMVLWISAQDEEILISTSQYFQNPFNSPLDQSQGIMGSDADGWGNQQNGDEVLSNLLDMAFLHQLANEFYKLLDIEESDTSKPVDIRVTSDGLRITVFDRGQQAIFKEGSSEFTDYGSFVIQNLAWLIDRHEMKVRIEGHTAKEFSIAEGSEDIGLDHSPSAQEAGDAEGQEPSGRNAANDPWELSIGRANEARSSLVHYALDPNKVERVTGFGDTKPLEGTDPSDESNRRLEISLLVN